MKSLFHICRVLGGCVFHVKPFVSVVRIESSSTPFMAVAPPWLICSAAVPPNFSLEKVTQRHAKVAQRHVPYSPESCKKNIHFVIKDTNLDFRSRKTLLKEILDKKLLKNAKKYLNNQISTAKFVQLVNYFFFEKLFLICDVIQFFSLFSLLIA